MTDKLLSRAVVYGIEATKGQLSAVAVADPINRTVCSFIGPALKDLPAELLKYDALIGLDIDNLLRKLGLAPERWSWRIDISPPQKTKKLNKQGRMLKITSELLISGTTGISRAFGDSEKIKAYISEGATGKLARRIEATAKALCAYYSYGSSHYHVLLRWGFIDDIVPCEHWSLPGDPHLYDILRESMQRRVPVELVIGSAPGWKDPWSRAVAVQVLSLDAWHIDVVRLVDASRYRVDRREIQTARLAPGTIHATPAASARS